MIKPLACLVFLLLIGTAHSQNGPYGLLWLDIQPSDANVALDGRFLDVNVWLMSLPPGSHDLRVQKPGFKPFAEHFDIESGQSLHLDVHLDQDDPDSGDIPGFP